MLPRVLETEAMDTAAEAADYDSMDHTEVNRRFVDDLLATGPPPGEVLDLGTGTAQIPIELARRHTAHRVLAVDLAEHMIALGNQNVQTAGLERVIRLEQIDAKRLPYLDGRFDVVMSNSIVHHIPEPRSVLAEAVRVLRPGGLVFVRDLLRPPDEATVRRLVATYAAGANDHQRQMFDDSLRAAFTLEEIRALVESVGFPENSVQQTSDRHWTWSATKA